MMCMGKAADAFGRGLPFRYVVAAKKSLRVCVCEMSVLTVALFALLSCADTTAPQSGREGEITRVVSGPQCFSLLGYTWFGKDLYEIDLRDGQRHLVYSHPFMILNCFCDGLLERVAIVPSSISDTGFMIADGQFGRQQDHLVGWELRGGVWNGTSECYVTRYRERVDGKGTLSLYQYAPATLEYKELFYWDNMDDEQWVIPALCGPNRIVLSVQGTAQVIDVVRCTAKPLFNAISVFPVDTARIGATTLGTDYIKTYSYYDFNTGQKVPLFRYDVADPYCVYDPFERVFFLNAIPPQSREKCGQLFVYDQRARVLKNTGIPVATGFVLAGQPAE